MPNRTTPGGSSTTNSNVFCPCNCTGPQPQGMDISELEFVQIIIILVVMTVMIVVIICLLNHYRLLALAFLTRHSQSHRDQATQLDASLWSDGVLAQQRTAEVMCGHLTSNLPPFMQQQLCHLQPTYPYLQQEIIDLPPIICLSDGEELPPYKGTCSLQLRDPEQQLELSRASVRAPPNRTIFDSDFIDIYIHGGGGGGGGGTGSGGGPPVPSSNSGVNAATDRMEDPPPSYSEAMGHFPASTDFDSQFVTDSQPQEQQQQQQGTMSAHTPRGGGGMSAESTTPATSGRQESS